MAGATNSQQEDPRKGSDERPGHGMSAPRGSPVASDPGRETFRFPGPARLQAPRPRDDGSPSSPADATRPRDFAQNALRGRN